MSNGQSFKMVGVTLHVTCQLKFEITIPWASTPVENKTRLYNTHTLYCIMIYYVILYIYYTYVTLVCGKSVVMRNYNNFSRLL